MIRKGISIGLVAILLGSPGTSFAYNWSTHSRIAESAVSIMQNMPAQVVMPQGADPNDWAAFLAAAGAAPDRLRVLRTGVAYTAPGAPQYIQHPTTGETLCYSKEGYPFNDNSCTPADEAEDCPVHADDNLNNMGVFRIMDFRYIPKRSAGPCGLEKESDPELVLRKVLGWQAGSPDDHYDDSHLWYRPTNAGFLGKAKGWASDGWTTGAGALLAPIACAWEAIFGDGCDLDDGAKLAKKYNPVDYVDSWLPGFGDVHGDPYPTLWHFINVDAGGPSQHNAPPGLVYPDAGPSYPGVMDVAIMAGAGLVGLSVHASKSDGVDFYGQYDDDGRGDNAWQAYDIGTIDFSPIDNLARYGWDDKFIAGGSISARGLAWPLHAIGDATAPHHVAGTSSWGHRPYEDYIDQYFDDLVFLLDDIELPEDAAQRQRILEYAFSYWMDLKAGTGVQQFVSDLAFETRFLVDLQDDWPYRDLASVDYHLGGDDAKHMAVESYRANNTFIRGHLERAIAASLALLVRASELATNPGFDPTSKCGIDEHYEPNAGCLPGPPGITPPPLNLPEICTEDATCQETPGCQHTCVVVAGCPLPYDGCNIEGCCYIVIK